MKTLYRIIGALVTWGFIALQYYVLLQSGAFGGFWAATLTYVSYFTILTNILVGLAFTAPLLGPESRLRHIFEKQSMRAAVALYIFVVMVVYWGMLASIHEREGLGILANLGVHLIVPILYLMDWLVFTPKRGMKFTRLPFWVIFPLGYGVYTLIKGMITGFYPYPFLDLSALSFGQVLVNMAGFTLFYLAGGAVFVGLGRVLPRVGE